MLRQLRRGTLWGADLADGSAKAMTRMASMIAVPRDQVKTETSVAVLPIPVPLVTILRGHRKRQFEERFAAGPQWRDTGPVFTTAHGGYVEPRNVNRMFHRLCEIANVPQLRVHDLRHSCATLLFTMGVPPATVQRILRTARSRSPPGPTSR